MTDNTKVTVTRKNIKNIYIRVRNCEVLVSAPLFTTKNHIEFVLKKREKWIKKQIEKQREKEKKQQNNNTVYHLGSPLKILREQKRYNSIRKNTSFLIVSGENLSKDEENNLILKWQQLEAQKIFNKLIERYSKTLNVKVNKVRIKTMKTRWGSCNNHKGYINLNLKLIEKPIECIEYVVLHELTHLIYPHHKKEFYKFIEKIMPDWRERRNKLK